MSTRLASTHPASTGQQKSDSDFDVLTPREAAKLLKISERTLWNLTKAGKIPAGRVGVQWRYSRQVLAAYAAGESV